MTNILEGLTILNSPPHIEGVKAPVVELDDGLVLDDRVFEAPTLLIGNTGSGKSQILERIMIPIMENAAEMNENTVIFCAKHDFLKFKRKNDIVISVNGTEEPEACWNIFRELDASPDPQLTARDIVKSLLSSQKTPMAPFFANAAGDILYNAIMCLYDDSKAKGIEYSNWHLVDFLTNTRIRGGDLSWADLAEIRPEYFGHIIDYIGAGDDLGQGYGVVSEITTMLHECFWGSFASDNGCFSAIETLKTGGKRLFLLFDYTASEASIKIFKTILTLLLKHSLNAANGRRTWVFLDEFSLLPELPIADAMSLGRSVGFRLVCALQSAQLMTRHYKEDAAKTLLSLFPNVICLKIQDSFSRSVISDRYGESLYSYVFNDAMRRPVQHAQFRRVVADYDFSKIHQKGDAICSIPNLSTSPFFYHGYRKELDN